MRSHRAQPDDNAAEPQTDDQPGKMVLSETSLSQPEPLMALDAPPRPAWDRGADPDGEALPPLAEMFLARAALFTRSN